MRWVWVLSILTCGNLGAAEEAPLERKETFSGEIISVQRYNLINRPNSYIQFLLKTSKGVYTVNAGSASHLSNQGFHLYPGELISVQGTLERDEPRIMAESLEQGQNRVKIVN